MQKEMCTRMFITALFVTVKNIKNMTVNRRTKLCYICIMEYCTAVEINVLKLCVLIWINLRNTFE